MYLKYILFAHTLNERETFTEANDERTGRLSLTNRLILTTAMTGRVAMLKFKKKYRSEHVNNQKQNSSNDKRRYWSLKIF